MSIVIPTQRACHVKQNKTEVDQNVGVRLKRVLSVSDSTVPILLIISIFLGAKLLINTNV